MFCHVQWQRESSTKPSRVPPSETRGQLTERRRHRMLSAGLNKSRLLAVAAVQELGRE